MNRIILMAVCFVFLIMLPQAESLFAKESNNREKSISVILKGKFPDAITGDDTPDVTLYTDAKLENPTFSYAVPKLLSDGGIKYGFNVRVKQRYRIVVQFGAGTGASIMVEVGVCYARSGDEAINVEVPKFINIPVEFIDHQHGDRQRDGLDVTVSNAVRCVPYGALFAVSPFDRALWIGAIVGRIYTINIFDLNSRKSRCIGEFKLHSKPRVLVIGRNQKGEFNFFQSSRLEPTPATGLKRRLARIPSGIPSRRRHT